MINRQLMEDKPSLFNFKVMMCQAVCSALLFAAPTWEEKKKNQSTDLSSAQYYHRFKRSRSQESCTHWSQPSGLMFDTDSHFWRNNRVSTVIIHTVGKHPDIFYPITKQRICALISSHSSLFYSCSKIQQPEFYLLPSEETVITQFYPLCTVYQSDV